MSSALSQIYFLLSGFQGVKLDLLPAEFQASTPKFSRATTMPTSIVLLPNSTGIYSINYDRMGVEDSQTILSQQGTSLESFFTKEKKEYAKYLQNSEVDPTTLKAEGEAFSYCHFGDMLMRSQLDCMHPLLPLKTFDIKTRATVAVRMNSRSPSEFTGYHIDKLHGMWNSFTREYYDMMRTAFLKYSFQVRIGNMDGLFVAYHNTEEIFGFQYVSREELDYSLFGGSKMGDTFFRLSLGILNNISLRAINKWPGESIRLLLATSNQNYITVYAERLQKGANARSPLTMPEPEHVEKWNIGIMRLINGQLSANVVPLAEHDEMELVCKVQESITSPVEEYLLKRSRLEAKYKSYTEVSDTPNAYGSQFSRFFNKNNEDADDKPVWYETYDS